MDLSLGGQDVRLPEDMIHNNDFDLTHSSLGARKLGHFTHMAVFNPKGLSRFGGGENPFYYYGNNEHKYIPGSDEYYIGIYNELYNELFKNNNLLNDDQQVALAAVDMNVFDEDNRAMLDFIEPEEKNRVKEILDNLYKQYQKNKMSMDTTSFGQQQPPLTTFQKYDWLMERIEHFREYNQDILNSIDPDTLKEGMLAAIDYTEGEIEEAKKYINNLYNDVQKVMKNPNSFGKRRRSKRKLYRGPKGGQYYIKKGRKVYV